MPSLPLRRREVLGTVVAACASVAGCTGTEDDEPEEDQLEHFGYGGQPVVHDQTGDGTPRGGDDDADPESTDDGTEDTDGSQETEEAGGFGALPAADPETEYGYQGYGEGGYGGVDS